MNEQEITATKEWIQKWAEIGPVLNRLDAERDFGVPLAEIIPQFNDALRAALALHPPQPYSGLIEQQQYFRRLRE
jgi:hypothetical protein